MQQNNTLLLIIVLLALMLAGEYYILVWIDPIVVWQAKDKLWMVLLKLSSKMAIPSRIGFVVSYLLWLVAQSKVAFKSKKRSVSNWPSFVSAVIFSICCYSLLTMDSFLPSLAVFMYPLSLLGICFSGLFLSPLLSFHNREHFGIKPEKQKRENPYSFHFKTKGGWINVVNPFRGIFISGGAGSGKSYSLAYPIIEQAIKKGYSGLIYDFKFPVLAAQVNQALIVRGTREVTHYIVNFHDPTRSHRLNPLKPENMPTVSYAEEYALSIIHNLLPESIRKKDFWIRSANAILTAVIWFYKKNHPRYCTLPHVVNSILYKDYLHLMSMLETDGECADMVRSALTAIENGAESQIAGVIGSLQIAIVRINSPEICWVLSGDDFELDLNNASDPKLLTLGSHPTLADSFSPVISCIATVALKLMNQPGKRHSIVLLDEAPTIYIPKLDMIPATARSNKVATIYMAQDFSQMVFNYGKEAADVILSNLNNQFYGRVGSLATAKHVSELFGKEEKTTQSFSSGRNSHEKGQSSNESVSRSLQEKPLLRPQDVTSLQVGEFVGMTVESKEPYFWDTIKVKEHKGINNNIPAFASGIEVERNFQKIKYEVESIINSYEKRKMNIIKTKQSI